MISVFPDVATLVENAAKQLVDAARDAVRQRGRFLLALSGGHSPEPLYKLLTRPAYVEQMPWRETVVLWSDERYVPLDDDRSNAGQALRILLDHVPVLDNHILFMYREDCSAEQAAAMYASSLRKFCGADEPRIDLVLLGCGEDTHTASLFPGSEAINAVDDLIVVVADPAQDMRRLTMTPRLINLARKVAFIVYGANKAVAVKRVLTEPVQPERFPAQAIQPAPGELLWLLDRASVSLLKTNYTSRSE